MDAALAVLAARVSLHLARHEAERPLTLFAVGPTGVGKTKAAETLADFLTERLGGVAGYLRLDMNEYQEPHRVSQLLGAPPGYLGYADAAPLRDLLASRPRAVVLFDEIDKAHPAMLTALMNAMDSGRFVSGSRAAIDCREAIFLFTSNAGAEAMLAAIGQEDDEDHSRQGTRTDAMCRAALLGTGMAPELVGRVATFLLFRSLSDAVRAEIVARAIVAAAQSVGLSVVTVAPGVVADLLVAAPNAALGARLLQHQVDARLGDALLSAVARGLTGHVAVLPGPRIVPVAPPEHAGANQTAIFLGPRRTP